MLRRLLWGVVTAWLLLAVRPAQAQLDLTLLSSAQTVSVGGTATFTGTITNPAGQPTLFLNGLDISVDGGLLINPAPLGLPVSLDSGSSFTGDLFTVTAPGGTLPGAYAGNLTITGGTDGTATDPLTPATPFTVNVIAATGAPEPTAFALLLFGAGWSGLVVTRNRRVSGG
jgi:hypothetical protein